MALSSFWQLVRHWQGGKAAKPKMSCEPGSLNIEVVPKKISDYQVSEKIHSKAGAKENIIMEIPLWPSAAENV